MIKNISKSEVPGWEYGDVAVKTFSFGEQMKIANLKAKLNKSGAELSDSEMDIGDVLIKILAAGIHYVKTAEGNQFIIKPGMSVEDRQKIVFDFTKEAGQYLVKQVQELNKEITKEEQKN